MVSLVRNICASTSQPDSFIIDAEIVAIDPTDGSVKSFQELSNRARKDVKIDDVKVAVCVFAFDLMYLDGRVSVLGNAVLLFELRTFHRYYSNSRFVSGDPFFVLASLRSYRRSRELLASITSGAA